MMGLYRIEVGDEGHFLSMRSSWHELAGRSAADPLFASWEWLATWWRHHRDDFELSARLLLAYQGNTLVGIAPCHTHRVVHRPCWPSQRCELIGSLWRTSSSVMSERTGFIVDRLHPRAYDALADAALSLAGLGDFVLSLADTAGPTVAALRRAAEATSCLVRVVDPMSAYHFDLEGGLDDVLARMSQNTRRQLFNKRSKLDSLGERAWEAASADDASGFYADLDRLHQARWGWAASQGRRGLTYREFGESLQPPDELVLRRLRVGGRTLAVSRAFRCGNRLYDVQSAMDPDFSEGISPGLLQIGFLIEEACTKGLQAVDLLGGSGRAADYKARLGGHETRLASLQIVRSRGLQALYRLYGFGQKVLTKAGRG